MSARDPLPRSAPGESFGEYWERILRLRPNALAIDVVRAWSRAHRGTLPRLVVDNTQETLQ